LCMFVGHQQGLFQLSDLFSVESLILSKIDEPFNKGSLDK